MSSINSSFICLFCALYLIIQNCFSIFMHFIYNLHHWFICVNHPNFVHFSFSFERFVHHFESLFICGFTRCLSGVLLLFSKADKLKEKTPKEGDFLVYTVTVFPGGKQLRAEHGKNLMELLQQDGHPIASPCHGNGKCAKCRVLLEDQIVLSCKIRVIRDMTVTLLSNP